MIPVLLLLIYQQQQANNNNHLLGICICHTQATSEILRLGLSISIPCSFYLAAGNLQTTFSPDSLAAKALVTNQAPPIRCIRVKCGGEGRACGHLLSPVSAGKQGRERSVCSGWTQLASVISFTLWEAGVSAVVAGCLTSGSPWQWTWCEITGLWHPHPSTDLRCIKPLSCRNT